MKIKTSELVGIALDWAVAQICDKHVTAEDVVWRNYSPSESWAQGGPIVEREKLSIVWAYFQWCATFGDVSEVYSRDGGNYFQGSGKTPLIAAMRCLVVRHLGDEVEVPDYLI